MKILKFPLRGLTLCFGLSAILFAASTTIALGATIALNSGSDPTGNLQWNSIGGVGIANTIISPNPVWQPPTGGAQWVSFTNSGVGGTILPSHGTFGAPSSTPTASFFHSFTLAFGSTGGGITVWTDDTAAVYVDSTLAFPVSTAPADSHCVDGPIGCGGTEGGFISLAGLVPGAHTIRIDAWQLGGDTFGVMYTGAVTSPESRDSREAPEAPEPATWLLLASGFVGLGIYRRLRG